MIADHEYIRQLFLEKLAGVISVTDDATLQQLIDKNEANRAFWMSLTEQSKHLNAEHFISSLDEHAGLEALKRLRTAKKTPIWKYAAAAAIFIVLGVGLWLNLLDRKNVGQETAAKKNISLNDKVIQLQLDNGEVLTLEKQSKDKVIDIANFKIQTSEKGIEAINGGSEHSQTTLHIPAKQDYQITLSDGTKVWLNSLSKLRFPIRFNGASREIYIEGEAYLEVAKDAKKPFIVHTKNTDISVLGTKFNLNTYNEGLTKTALIEGAVLLTSSQKSIKLSPGQQGNYSVGQGFSVTSFDQDQTLSWINGVYYFQNSSLKEISDVINRWFDIEIVFETPQIANIRLSGMIEKQQLTSFLKDLETSSDVQSRITPHKLYLK